MIMDIDRPIRQQGFSLIELMISLVIGLVIIGAVVTVFLSTSNSYRTNDALGRIQENARFAFELMSRDIREAGAIPCGSGLDIANVLVRTGDSADDWWRSMGNGIQGYNSTQTFPAKAIGTNVGDRVAGTDALRISGSTGSEFSVSSHQPSSATIHLMNDTEELEAGDIVMICDFGQSAIFQVSGPNGSGAINHVNHAADSGQGTPDPGNCTKALGLPIPTDCTSKAKGQDKGTDKEFGPNSVIAKFASTGWYIGCNGRDGDCSTPEGRSLYRIVNGGNAEEVVDSIGSMTLSYLADGEDSYKTANNVTDWSLITAVKINLGVARSGAGTNNSTLGRSFNHVVALRNRL